MYININGLILNESNAYMPFDNPTFRYGFGIFETMLVCNGKIELCQYHYERLRDGIGRLNLLMPELLTIERLVEHILDTVKANRLESICRVRLQVFSRSGSLQSADTLNVGFLIACYPMSESELLWNENGLDVTLAMGIAKSNDTLSNLKSSNELIYVVAAQQARRAEKDDALICNTAGNIIESTIANIFWVKEGRVFTPPLSEGCVAGVMRRFILENTSNIVVQPMTKNDLIHADEVFLTNAIKRIKWISSFAYVNYGCALTKKLYAGLFRNHLPESEILTQSNTDYGTE